MTKEELEQLKFNQLMEQVIPDALDKAAVDNTRLQNFIKMIKDLYPKFLPKSYQKDVKDI